MSDCMFALLDEIGQPSVGIGLVGRKVDLVELVLEVVFEGECVVVGRVLVVVAVEGRGGEGEVVCGLVPAESALVPLLQREDGDQHALMVEGTLFDYVEEVEPS